MEKPELKVVLYRGNSYPRTFEVKTNAFSKLLFLLSSVSIVFILGMGFFMKQYLRNTTTTSNVVSTSSQDEEFGPFNSSEEKVKKLADDVDRLNTQIKNLQLEKESPKDLDTKNPVLAILSPVVTDQTKSQKNIMVKSFSFTPGNGREPTSLSFELHNAEPNASVQKGYIIVLARTKNALKFYPNVLNSKGTYLIDFEKGETFQVSRFRMVNAQYEFDAKDPIINFQILIFKRTGELLLNLLTEVNMQ